MSEESLKHILKGEQLQELGRHEKAIEEFGMAISAGYDEIYAKSQITISYLNLKNLPAAEKMAQNILSIDADNFESISHLGFIALQREQLGKAEKLLLQSLKIEAEYLPSLIYLVQVYLKAGKAVRAEKYLNRALEMAPDHPHLLKLRVILSADQEDQSGIDKMIGDVLSMDPHETDMLSMKAALLLDQKKYGEAKEIALQSLASDPNSELGKSILLHIYKSENSLLRFFFGNAFSQYKLEFTFWRVLWMIIAFKGVMLWGGFFVIYMLITWYGGVAFNTWARYHPKYKLLLSTKDIWQSNALLIFTSLILFFLLVGKVLAISGAYKAMIACIVLLFMSISIFEVANFGNKKMLLGITFFVGVVLYMMTGLEVLVYAIFSTLILILHGVLYTLRVYGSK